MPESPDVILLRSADEQDQYLATFNQAGLRAICEPVLTFAFPNQTPLRQHLERRDQYEGLIVTSPRVATALDRLFVEHRGLSDSWKEATAYAVGPKTAKRLRELGLAPRGDETGDAEALARLIVDDAPSAPLLFLCGNRRRDTLPDRLRTAGVPFEELVVYETRTRQDLTIPPPEGTTWLVFFSPSGLEAVEEAASVDLQRLQDYRLAAIGPTTGKAVEEAGFSVDAIAAVPSPDGLLKGILSA